MSFLDCNGALIPYAYEAWRDEGRDKQSKNKSFNSDRPWFFLSFKRVHYFVSFFVVVVSRSTLDNLSGFFPLEISVTSKGKI